VVKLLDYRHKWDELEHDPNPFAIATLAFLKTVETQGNDQERYQWKKHFLLQLYRKGMRRETILALYEFIGVIMALPEAKDEALYDEIEQTTEETQMSLLAIAERKGREKEKILGLREMISDILEIKFGAAGLELFDPVEQITNIKTLQKIRAGLKRAQSVAKAKALIHAHAKERSRAPRA
jgi:hypothetical protein